MAELIKKRVLITVRTYPVPATKGVEVSCTAGVTHDGKWIRLFPLPYRLLEDERKFKKYQWIDVNVTRACPQLSQMIAAARWTAARKFLAVLS